MPPAAPEEFTVGNGEDKLGFIMFECGFEGIKLKLVKRSQFEKGENGIEEKKVATEIFAADIRKSQDECDNTASEYILNIYERNDYNNIKYISK